MADSGDFYIGYQPQAPRGTSAFVRRVIVGLTVLAIAIAALLAALQKPLGDGTFEYGRIEAYAGRLGDGAYPIFVGAAQGGESASAKTFLLVGEGKHGAEAEVAGLDGAAVALDGTLIHRDGQAMLEVVSGSVTAAEAPAGLSTRETPIEDLGERTLSGEIVDSKCYLGVMKPGDGKTHRACAALCIRGGIPPILVVRTSDGGRRHILLVDREGGAVGDRVLTRVAEPVEITGRLERHGELLMLLADPSTYRFGRIPR